MAREEGKEELGVIWNVVDKSLRVGDCGAVEHDTGGLARLFVLKGTRVDL